VHKREHRPTHFRAVENALLQTVSTSRETV
jgi:hypothetical protein